MYNFFSRYYEDGDFIPKRRYGAQETYAVPYNGEEVFFTWANRDQHYVKTTERFQDYAFKLRGLTGEYYVRFIMTKANIPKDNTKGNTRYFFPCPERANYHTENREFVLPFEHRLLTPDEAKRYGANSKAQEAILEEALPRILEAVPDENLYTLLNWPPDKSVEAPTVMLKRLRHFCRRNTSDYFIHKNLTGFLTRELEFYIKDQIIHLMDLEADLDAKRLVVKIFRKLAERVIGFLATIENIQKTLFEKKKFVLETDYLIPIKYVPRDFWPKILQNEGQLEEWCRWLALEPEKNLFNSTGKVNEAFLETHPTLPVHTKHFERDFVRRLMEALPFDDLDETTDGLLMHGENYQALRLLQERHREQVKCIYIDPPYNTGSDEFIYKDRYQHSSWLTMMEERLQLARELMREDGAIFVSIDDNEAYYLRQIMDIIWEQIGIFVWEKKKKGSHLSTTFRDLTEYVFAYARQVSKLGTLYGEAAYSDKWQPLIKRSNAERELLFPAGQIQAALDDGTYKTGIYGDGQTAVQLLDPIVVKEGVIKNKFRMRARFVWTQETLEKELASGSIVRLSKNLRPNALRAGQEEKTKRPPSLITKDIAAYEDAFAEIVDLFGEAGKYNYPKPSALVMYLVNTVSFFNPEGTVLDFFAGSGTTAHAVINLNRADGGRRKFIIL